MISSLITVVALCGVAVSEESRLVNLITERKKAEPRVDYQEGHKSSYPIIIQQPYPVIVEKRIPYSEERYDVKAIPGVYTSTGEELGYETEVVRSPIIFTVSSQPTLRSTPYPLRVQKETWPPPCTGEVVGCPNGGFDYSVKYPVKKKDTYNAVEGAKEVNERDVSISSDYEGKEGSVQHRETFQTPILIALEKPGYKYVKHLVGEGVLPKARQFHVLILEEDPSTSNSEHTELNSAENEQKDLNTFSEDTLNDNKHVEKANVNEDKTNTKSEGINIADSKIIFSSTKEESKTDDNGSPCEYKIKQTTEKYVSTQPVSKATIDIKKK